MSHAAAVALGARAVVRVCLGVRVGGGGGGVGGGLVFLSWPGVGGCRCLCAVGVILLFGDRDPLRGRNAVDEVEVGVGAQHVHRGVAERLRFLVLLGAGVDDGHRGEGLVGGQVAAGQAGR